MYARAYVRIWTLRSWYNNYTSQWQVKIETRPFYGKKLKFGKTWRSNLVCQGTCLGSFTKGQINITEEKLLSLVVIAWMVLKLFYFLARGPRKLPLPRPSYAAGVTSVTIICLINFSAELHPPLNRSFCMRAEKTNLSEDHHKTHK